MGHMTSFILQFHVLRSWRSGVICRFMPCRCFREETLREAMAQVRERHHFTVGGPQHAVEDQA
jgi:hypothetical protein